MDVLLLSLTKDNYIQDITIMPTAERLEYAFMMAALEHGMEVQEADYDNGYIECEDGITVCMTTAFDD